MTGNKGYVLYLIVINIITFAIFGWDKYKAIRQEWRIRESTLLGLSLIGGSIGGWIAMYTFHHKTKKAKFYIGVPAILLLQIIVLIYLLFGGGVV